MIAQREKTVNRIVLSDISWQGYEGLLREVGDSHLRLTYDEGELEIMTLSFEHENAGEWLGRLVFFLALELDLPLCSGGSTTFKIALRRKGLEPDKCFWILHEQAMRGKKNWEVLIDPPPDLVVEVDITSSSLDRLAIYAALKVPEIWHYDGTTFRVLILGAHGLYKEKSKSLAFPALPLTDFARFLTELGTTDEIRLIQSFTAWIRANLTLKKNASSSRKNGKKSK